MPSPEKGNNYYANQIAQLIAPRFFKQKGFKSLPDKYWRDKRFARDYALTLMRARSLLKTYSPDAILNALKSKEGLRVWSLNAKWLDGIIAAEEKKLQLLQEKIEEYRENIEATPALEPVRVLKDSPRPAFSPGKSAFEKLG